MGFALSLLQPKTPQFPQPPLTGLVSQTIPQPHIMATLQHLNVLLRLRGPKLNPTLKVRLQRSRIQGDREVSTMGSEASRLKSDQKKIIIINGFHLFLVGWLAFKQALVLHVVQGVPAVVRGAGCHQPGFVIPPRTQGWCRSTQGSCALCSGCALSSSKWQLNLCRHPPSFGLA